MNVSDHLIPAGAMGKDPVTIAITPDALTFFLAIAINTVIIHRLEPHTGALVQRIKHNLWAVLEEGYPELAQFLEDYLIRENRFSSEVLEIWASQFLGEWASSSRVEITR